MAHSLSIVLETILLLACFFDLRVADFIRDLYNARIENSLNFRCSTTANVTASYENNSDLLLSDFTVKSSLQSFYNTSIGNSPDKVYGYYMCRGDLTQQACSNCILNGTQFAAKSSCRNDYVDGFFQSGKCLFGYSNRPTYGMLETRSALAFDYVQANVSNHQQFNQTLSSIITAVINEAASDTNTDGDGSVPGFATKEANVTGEETIYSMAQCTPDILGENCSLCLTSGFSALQRWGNGAPSAIAFMAKCQLRYDTVPFYDVLELQSSKGDILRLNLQAIFSAVLFFMYYNYLVIS